jgi:glycosyltransferase involved in cell wall biosynthesis
VPDHRASGGRAGTRRVLLVGKGPPESGGIPAFLKAVLESRLSGTYRLELCNLSDPDADEGGRFSASNVRRTIRRVWSAARGSDVVHIHTALSPTMTCLRAGALALVGRLRGARVLVHVHGGQVAGWMIGPVRRAATRLALTPAASVITVCEAGRDALQDVLGPERVSLIDNGVEVEALPSRTVTTREAPRIVFAGLISERKGLLELFEAARRLRLDGVAHELVVAGGNHEEGPAEEARVRELGADVAVFTGQLDRPAVLELLASADVACLPSWVEAMPLVLLEAMAAGVPVVATPVGDISRLVQHAETGMLVPPKDVDALTVALRTLLEDPSERARLGAAGKHHVAANFSLERTLASLDALYR